LSGGRVELRETGPLWGPSVPPGEVTLSPETSGRPGGLDFGALEPLGQVGGLFIAARGPDGLYLVDQHAAHERVLYERLLAEGQREERPAQVLVAPETLDLGPGEEEALSSSLEMLRETGFDLEPFGGRTVMVRAVPAALAGVSGARLVADFLDRLGHEKAAPGKAAEPDRMRAARILASCRAALKGGEPLTLEAMRALLRDLAGCDEPRTCPHGRPTVLRLGLEEIRRRFGRQGPS
jgi:DNA mismatch repair protein MutL